MTLPLSMLPILSLLLLRRAFSVKLNHMQTLDCLIAVFIVFIESYFAKLVVISSI